jgi:hypothetical protein
MNYSIDVNARMVWHCFLAVPHEVATDGTSTRSPLAESVIDRYQRWKKTVPGHRETEQAMSTGGGRVIENFRLVVPTKKAARKFANHFGGNKV